MKKSREKLVQSIWIAISFRFTIEKKTPRWTGDESRNMKISVDKNSKLKQGKRFTPKYKQILSGSIFLGFFITFKDTHNNEMIIIYAFKTSTHFSWSCYILRVHIFSSVLLHFLLIHSLLVVHSVCSLHCVWAGECVCVCVILIRVRGIPEILHIRNMMPINIVLASHSKPNYANKQRSARASEWRTRERRKWTRIRANVKQHQQWEIVDILVHSSCMSGKLLKQLKAQGKKAIKRTKRTVSGEGMKIKTCSRGFIASWCTSSMKVSSCTRMPHISQYDTIFEFITLCTYLSLCLHRVVGLPQLRILHPLLGFISFISHCIHLAPVCFPFFFFFVFFRVFLKTNSQILDECEKKFLF